MDATWIKDRAHYQATWLFSTSGCSSENERYAMAYKFNENILELSIYNSPDDYLNLHHAEKHKNYS